MLRHGVTGPMARGWRPARVPQVLSGWGSGQSLTRPIDKVGPAPRPFMGAPGRPDGHPRFVQHPAQVCHSMTSAADAGLLLRHGHTPPSQRATRRSCYDEASGQRSSRRTDALDLPAFGICTRAFVFNAQSTRAFMFNAQRVFFLHFTASRCTEGRPRDQGKSVTLLCLTIRHCSCSAACKLRKTSVCVCVCIVLVLPPPVHTYRSNVTVWIGSRCPA